MCTQNNLKVRILSTSCSKYTFLLGYNFFKNREEGDRLMSITDNCLETNTSVQVWTQGILRIHYEYFVSAIFSAPF